MANFFFAGTFLYLLGFGFFFLTGSLFYFGEAVSYEGLMRMLLGLPFASATPTLPVSLTPYSPLFLLPLAVIGKLAHISTIERAIPLARGYQTILLVLLFLSINRMRKHFFPQVSDGVSFVCACLLLFFYNPVMELALRPDTLSFLCEFWAVYSVLLFTRCNQDRFIWISSLFFSLALAVKLNTAGCLLGTLGYFLTAKDWKALLKLGTATFFLTLLLLGGHELFLGEAFSKNILLSIQSQIWHLGGAIEVYKKVFDLLLIPLGFYFFLIIFGVQSFEEKNQSRYFVWILSVSFLLALVGQLKWGAYHNYFLGSLYLGLLPASCAIHRLSQISRRTLFFSVALVTSFFIFRSVAIPVKIFLDKRYFFELDRLQELVNEKAPKGFIYTQDEKIQLGFVGKSAFGVLTEELIWTTPKLSPLLPVLKQELNKAGSPQAFITLCSAGLSQASVQQWGFSDLSQWDKTQTGNYCLYTHANH